MGSVIDAVPRKIAFRSLRLNTKPRNYGCKFSKLGKEENPRKRSNDLHVTSGGREWGEPRGSSPINCRVVIKRRSGDTKQADALLSPIIIILAPGNKVRY